MNRVRLITTSRLTVYLCGWLALLISMLPFTDAADSVGFNGSGGHGQIEPWQPQGDYKIVAWLSELNPNADAKTMLLSNSLNSNYLMFTHNSLQLQFGGSYPGIWNKFNFNQTNYLEVEVSDGKLIASDGDSVASVSNAAIVPTQSRFDWLFRRGGGYSRGWLDGLALIDLENPDNSRAYAFDRQRGVVQVGGQADAKALINVGEQDWRSSSLVIENPMPSHFDDEQWLQAFYPDQVAPDPDDGKPPLQTSLATVQFDGKQSYAAIDAWVPSGKFTVIAYLDKVNPNVGTLNMLLSSSNTSEYLAFSHNNVQGKWGPSFPGIWNKFAFNKTNYIEITVDHGSMQVSDGIATASVKSTVIDPTSVAYDWVFRRGGGFFLGALQSLTLIDHSNPKNSRSYAMDKQLGMLEVNDNAGQLYGLTQSSWLAAQRTIENPAPDHFSAAAWQRVYGVDSSTDPDTGVPDPDPDPDPDPEPDPNPNPDPDPDPDPDPPAPKLQYAVSFGDKSYAVIPKWRPSGRYKVIAYLRGLNPDPDSYSFLLSDSSNNNYLSFNHKSVKGQWQNKYPGIYGKFDFAKHGYIEYLIEAGKMTVTDGYASASVSNAAINPTLLSFDWIFRRGGSYSTATLQSLTLLDLQRPSNSRSYTFNQQQQLVEVNGHDGELIAVAADRLLTSDLQIDNVAPDHFSEDKWQALYGGGGPSVPDPDPEPEPDPNPDPEPDPDPDPDPLPPPPVPDGGEELYLSDNKRELRFNGRNAYFDFQRWAPAAAYRVAAWVKPQDQQPVYIVSGGDGYLAITNSDFIGVFDGHQIRMANLFAFDETGYVDIYLKRGAITVSDGRIHNTVVSSRIDYQAYDVSMRYGNDYSAALLQGLALIDYSNDDRMRAYSFDDSYQIQENSSAPSRENRLHGISDNDWQPPSFGVFAPQGAIRSQADWDKEFAHYSRRGRPLLSGTNGNDNDSFPWHGHYWLRAYLMMAATYEDDKYLDYAVELTEHMLYYTDAKRAKRGELNIAKQPYANAPKAYLLDRRLVGDGWRRPFNGYRLTVLTDGQVLNAIMRVVDYIKTHQKQDYMALADDFLAQAQAIVNNHNSSFSNSKNAEVAGSYFYVNDKNDLFGNGGLYSNPLPYNHNLTLAVAMIYIDKWQEGGDAAMRAKVEEIVRFFESHLQYGDDGTCEWNYAFDVNGNVKPEDSSHGHMDVGFLLVANQEGYVSDDLLQCMTLTLTERVFVAPGVVAYDVLGTGIASEMDQLALTYDWSDLSRIDPRIQQMSQFVLYNFGDPDWSRAFFGWATQLYWQQHAN